MGLAPDKWAQRQENTFPNSEAVTENNPACGAQKKQQGRDEDVAIVNNEQAIFHGFVCLQSPINSRYLHSPIRNSVMKPF